MANFTYVALNKQGKEVKGTIDAADENSARAKLKADGFTPLQVNVAGVLDKNISFGGGKVKTRDLSVLCRQFNSILKAGVPVVEALNMLENQTGNKVMKKALNDTRVLVEQGETLASAMSKFPNAFPDMLVTMVDAGEQSGSLETSFERMGQQFDKTAKLQGLLKKAMIYPIVLVVVAIVVVIVMSVAVIPKFAEMFAEMGSDLPAATKMVLALSHFLMYRWYVLIIIVVGAIVGYKITSKTEKGMEFYGKIALNAPIFGKLNVKSYSASFSRTLSTLVGSGLGLSQSLEITARALTNIYFKRAVENTRKEIEQGVNLSMPIRKSGVFPVMVPNMISIGEQTGNVEDMLDKVAEYYEEETELATQGLTAMMEPLIIVVLGVIVGVLVLAMYQPMISMYGGLKNL